MSDSLSPEVKAALEHYRRYGKNGSRWNVLHVLADAFAAQHPPELEPGIHLCDYKGKPSVMDVRTPQAVAAGNVKYALQVIDSRDGGCWKTSLPPSVTNIRRIDDGGAWREWATKKRTNAVGTRTIIEILEHHGWCHAAIELDELLEQP